MFLDLMILINVPQDPGFQNPSLCMSVFTQVSPIPLLNSTGLKRPSFPAAHETILILDVERKTGSIQRKCPKISLKPLVVVGLLLVGLKYF